MRLPAAAAQSKNIYLFRLMKRKKESNNKSINSAQINAILHELSKNCELCMLFDLKNLVIFFPVFLIILAKE